MMDSDFDNEFVPIPEHDCPNPEGNPDNCGCFEWDFLYNCWVLKKEDA